MRLSICLLVATFLAASSIALGAHPIEKGVAITDSEAMRELETRGFAFSAMMSPSWKRGEATRVMSNAELTRIAPIASLKTLVGDEFSAYLDNYIKRTGITRSRVTEGTKGSYRLFDLDALVSEHARFELVGVINRMDRMFRSPTTCGEVRLIYRLAYRIEAQGMKPRLKEGGNPQKDKDWIFERQPNEWVESRLPMTLNLVLGARAAPKPGEPERVKCEDIAKRWIESGKSNLSGAALARQLLAKGGLMELVAPEQIDRLESNLQVIRVPAFVAKEFGGNAEYLLHVFKWNSVSRTFSIDNLENQIDRSKLLADKALMADFKAWLNTPEQLHKLAEGTIEIPKRFLAYRAITSAPGGTARATNRPFMGLMSDAEAEKLYSSLREAAAKLDPEKRLRNIASAQGLQQRLNDVTCTGCHQSRAIGGFHFLGADRKASIAKLPQNSIFVPGSAHFYSDLPRRRAVVEAIAARRTPDEGRGFAMRPRVTGRGGKVVFPASYDGLRRGWGANCATDRKGDASFRDWGCAPGLVCKTLHHSEAEAGLGICLSKASNLSELKIGDPFIFGTFKAERVSDGLNPNVFRFRDRYCPTEDVINRHHLGDGQDLTTDGCLPTPGDPDNESKRKYVRGEGAYQFGGFFGGLRKRRVKDCSASAAAGTACTSEAGLAFTECVMQLDDRKTSFVPCLTLPLTTARALVRSCNIDRPCRDDYVCLATSATAKTGLGACLPPYFLFQFRIDGHPQL